jgi:ATP-dependent DNA helicase DinG
VFFPSQGALRTVHHALKAILPEGTPCWGQHVDGNRDAVLRLFASEKGGWVLATEGIPGLKDASGNGPALALITRMPLPPAHDPVLEARGEILKAEGKNARAELWHPAAVLRLKKEWAALGAGGGSPPRVLWLLDARASAEGLGALAARSLGSEPESLRNAEDLTAATRAIG